MSKYTTDVRFICETASGLSESADFGDVDNIISKCYANIFDTSWSIYDEDYRSVLCCKILKHYYTREICAETVGLWKMWLNERMGMIMPYYNQMYETTILSFDPFTDIDYYDKMEQTGTHDETSKSESTSESDTTTKQTTSSDVLQWDKYSATPQGAVSGLDSDTYLTNANKMTNDASGTANTTFGAETSDNIDSSKNVTTTDDYLKHVYGKFNSGKSYMQLVKEVRENILNIDAMIIEELNDLFFTLW